MFLNLFTSLPMKLWCITSSRYWHRTLWPMFWLAYFSETSVSIFNERIDQGWELWPQATSEISSNSPPAPAGGLGLYLHCCGIALELWTYAWDKNGSRWAMAENLPQWEYILTNVSIVKSDSSRINTDTLWIHFSCKYLNISPMWNKNCICYKM